MARGRDVIINILTKYNGRGAKEAVRDLDKVDKSTKGFAKSIAGLVGAGVAIDFLQDATEAASNLEEQVSAANVTFGEASEGLQEFGEDAAVNLGLSERAALQAANGFGAFFKAAGASQEQAAQLAEGMVSLGADLASFKNLRVEDALAKLQSGLSGEAEPLRQLGVFLNDAEVKAKAMEMGLAGAHDEVTDGDKILARYALILEKTADAQGDVARTSESFANQQRRASADFENASAKFGENLKRVALPVLKELNAELERFSHDDNVGKPVIGPPWATWDKDASFPKKVWQFLVTGADDAKAATSDYEKVWAKLDETTKDNTRSAREFKQEIADKAWDELPDKILDAAEAHLTLADATDRVRDAQRVLDDERSVTAEEAEEITEATEDLAEAQKELADLQSTEVVRAERMVAQARLDSAHAANALQDAEEGLREAQAEVARVVGDPAATPRQVAKAQEDLADAQLEVEDAQMDVKESSEKVDDALRQQREGTDELKDATKRATEAQKDLDRTRADSIGTIEEQEAAERRLEQAKLGVERATRGIDQAEKDLATTRAEAGIQAPPPHGGPNVPGGGTVRDFDRPGSPVVNVNVGNVGADQKAILNAITDAGRKAALLLT